MSTTQPEALQLAQFFESMKKSSHRWHDGTPVHEKAAAELRRQHARIADLKSQLASIGAGGVSPLMGAAGDAGWVMVPVDPTPEMCAVASIDEGARITDGPVFAAYLYSAMLAASPPAPSSAKGVAHG